MPNQLYFTCRSCEGNTGIAAENNRYEQEKDCDHVLTDNKRQTLDKSTATAPCFFSSLRHVFRPCLNLKCKVLGVWYHMGCSDTNKKTNYKKSVSKTRDEFIKPN